MTVTLWQNILHGGLAKGSSAWEEAFVINAYSLIAVSSLTISGILHTTIEANPQAGYLEIAGGLAMLGNVMGLRVVNSVVLARNLLLLIMLTLLIVILMTGGRENTGIFWFFMFPISAFFLAGRRQGLVWLAILLSTILLFWVASFAHMVPSSYTTVTLRQLFISMVVVSIAIYAYQRSREVAVARSIESHKDLQDFLDRMTTFTAKITPSGTILFANKIAAKALGMEKNIIGANFIEGPWWSFDPEVQRRVRAAFTNAVKGEAIVYNEQMQMATPKGPTVSVINFTMSPVMERGRVKYVLAEGRDITSERDTERAKTEFVTLASHQLRTPISAIAWVSELLTSGDIGKLKPEQLKYVSQISQSNQRMAALVDAMLTASRLELQDLSIRPEIINVAKISHEAVETQKKLLLRHKKITVTEHYDPDLPQLFMDPTVVKTILYNLIANALKYTQAGTVTVTVKMRAGTELLLEVADTGLGIPQASQHKIFSKLFRAENTARKDTDGTGLGLYIVKAMAEYVGGRISFVSQENKGSTFSVLLPTAVVPHKKGVAA